MLLSCVDGGAALNIVGKAKIDNDDVECGYTAYTALQQWFMDPSQKSRMLEHYDSKLETLALDQDTTASEFINNFEQYV